jgi:sulfur carrier protein
MKIKVNSNILELNEENQLSFLLKQLSLEEKKGIAVAVNAEVIPKKQWQEFKLNENDEVIIIQAAQGG